MLIIVGMHGHRSVTSTHSNRIPPYLRLNPLHCERIQHTHLRSRARARLLRTSATSVAWWAGQNAEMENRINRRKAYMQLLHACLAAATLPCTDCGTQEVGCRVPPSSPRRTKKTFANRKDDLNVASALGGTDGKPITSPTAMSARVRRNDSSIRQIYITHSHVDMSGGTVASEDEQIAWTAPWRLKRGAAATTPQTGTHRSSRGKQAVKAVTCTRLRIRHKTQKKKTRLPF